MKAFLTKLNDLQKTLFITLIIGVFLAILSIIGIFFNQPGWIIGTILGTGTGLVNSIMLFKGSDFILKKQKAVMFLLMFFVRMALIVVVFLFCVLMQFQLHINAFTNSIWGALIGFMPSIVLVIWFQGKKPIEVEGEK